MTFRGRRQQVAELALFVMRLGVGTLALGHGPQSLLAMPIAGIPSNRDRLMVREAIDANTGVAI